MIKPNRIIDGIINKPVAWSCMASNAETKDRRFQQRKIEQGTQCQT